MAAAYGDIVTVRKLVHEQKNMVNAVGNTALMYACQGGRMTVLKFLIQYEDIKHRNN